MTTILDDDVTRLRYNEIARRRYCEVTIQVKYDMNRERNDYTTKFVDCETTKGLYYKITRLLDCDLTRRPYY